MRPHHESSFLFTVRLWPEEVNNGQREWRGKVQGITTGEMYYFREWQMLVQLLLSMLPDLDTGLREAKDSQQVT